MIEKGMSMKYMIQWRIHDDKRHDGMKAFAAMNSAEDEPGLSGVNLIGRWHDVVGFTGVAIVETDDSKALGRWLLNWNSIIDIDATPVLDDQETRELGREFLGQ